MSYSIPCAPYEITVSSEPGPFPDTSIHLRTEIKLGDIDALPVVVKRLIDMGYDLSDTAKALREAEEVQRKRKRDELEENRRMMLAGLEPKSKRFVIAYNNVGKTSVGTAEGIVFKDGSIYIPDSSWHRLGGLYTGEKGLTSFAKERGYELFIKRFDD